MPVITAGSEHLPEHISVYINESQRHQHLLSRLTIFLSTVTILTSILLVLLLLHRPVTGRRVQDTTSPLSKPRTARTNITDKRAICCALCDSAGEQVPRSSLAAPPGRAPAAAPREWATKPKPRQGQACCAEEASLTISRGRDAVPAGQAGPSDGTISGRSAMEEEERIRDRNRSRNRTRTSNSTRNRQDVAQGSRVVSNDGASSTVSPRPDTSSSRLPAGQGSNDDLTLFPPTLTSHQQTPETAGGSFLASPGATSQASMSHEGVTILAGLQLEPDPSFITDAPHHHHHHLDPIFSPGRHTASDDEHVFYGTTGSPPRAATTIPRHLDEARPPPTQATSVQSMPVPPGRTLLNTASGSGTDEAFSPSSYPSASPLLPPAPPTTSTAEHAFDPSVVMFPGGGPIIDGGIRMVPVHDHDGVEGGVDALGRDGAETCWTRHTRVYGGGVCLACAAASDGGFYGSRVRPEDKR